MTVEVLADAEAVARRAAETIAVEARLAVEERGRFTIAISGGRTPWLMLRQLAALDMPWASVDVLQVDERVAPEGHTDRNLTHLRESLGALGNDMVRIHPMPVNATDLGQAARDYEGSLAAAAGAPAVLDLVHLGLGPDGHTASLVPGDPVLEISATDVAITGPYQGRRRMTLTYPLLNRARRVLWVITGADKAAMFDRLRRGDDTIPAGGIRRDSAIVLADRAAAGQT